MSKKIAKTPVDPTLPNIELKIDETSYHLCFDFAALAIAERRLRAEGLQVNMLAAMDLRELGAERLPILFFAALVRLQPEITFSDVSALITMENFAVIYQKVVDAYVASCVPKGTKEEEEQPDPPVEAVAE